MNFDNSIIDMYFNNRPSDEYKKHWAFYDMETGEHIFTEPSAELIPAARDCQEEIVAACGNFTLRNAALAEKIFGDTSLIMDNATVLFTAGLRRPYDAMVREHENAPYIIIDLLNFYDYIEKGLKISELINNFLSHELIHVFIYLKYPLINFNYAEYLNYITFQEGFAHLLSYKDNLAESDFADVKYKEKFDKAKAALFAALRETNPEKQSEYYQTVNSGDYWEKFGAISAMLYLARHIGELREIYEAGWDGFAEKIVNFEYNI